MTKKQLQALLDYIDARIDEKIQDAFGRDALNESVRRAQFGSELERAFEASDAS